MTKSTKNILLVLIVIAALAAAGLLYYSYFYQKPAEKKPVTTEAVDPETQVDEEVQKAGRNYSDEINEDGTITRSFTVGASQYLTGEGIYKPIDTKLVASTGDYDYENTKNVFSSYFKADSQADDLIRIQIGDRAATLSFVATNKSEAVAENNTVTYPDIYDGLAAKYTITGNRFLEELVAEKEVLVDKISQKIKLEGVYYKKQTDGSITFHDEKTKKIVWLIPRPVMYEQGELANYNFNLHYEVTETDDGYIISKVIDQPGQDWLKRANYPVVIDYSLFFDSDPLMDGEILFHWGSGTTTVSNGTELGAGIAAAGFNTNGNSSYRSYLSFDTSSIESGTIESATLRAYMYRSNDLNRNIRAYSGADLWTGTWLTTSAWNAWSEPQANREADVITAGLPTSSNSCFSNPVNCLYTMSINVNSVTSSGKTQITFTDHDVPMTLVRLLSTFTGGASDFFGNPRDDLKPELEVVFTVAPPTLNIIEPPTVQRQLELTLTDNSDNEDYWVMQRSTNGVIFSTICNNMVSGNSGTCSPVTTASYNCSGTSTAGLGGACSFTDTNLNPNTLYYYQVYAERVSPYARSPNSNIVSAYTLAAAISSPPTVSSPRWGMIRITSLPSASGVFCLGTDFTNWTPLTPSSSPPSRYLYNRFGEDEAVGIQSYLLSSITVPVGHPEDCHTLAEWSSLGIPPINMAGADPPYSAWPNRRFEVGLYASNSDGILTHPTEPAGEAIVYSRARRPATPTVTPVSSTTLNISLDPVSAPPNPNLSDGIPKPPDSSCPGGQPCVCGDANEDGFVTGSDIIYLVNFIFGGGSRPVHMWSADVNGDSVVNKLDILYLLDWLRGLVPYFWCGGISNAATPETIANANDTDYAVQNSVTGQYVNPSTGSFVSTESWGDFDASGGTPHWNGAGGLNVGNLLPNTCYNFRAKSRNNDGVVGQELNRRCSVSNDPCTVNADCPSGQTCRPNICSLSGESCGVAADCPTTDYGPSQNNSCSAITEWTAGTGTVCTLAAVPGPLTVNCNYKEPAQGDYYYCEATINANNNPNGTRYKIEYCLPGSGDDCSLSGAGWKTIESENWTPHNNGDRVTFREGVNAWLSCSVNNTTQLYRIKARNQNNVETDWRMPNYPTTPREGWDTLPPCQPLNMRHDNNPIEAGPVYPLYWAWNVPSGGETTSYYDFFAYDGINSYCLAGTDKDGFCTLVGPKSTAPTDPHYDQYKNYLNQPLGANSPHRGYVRAIDARKRSSRPADVHAAFTAIQSPTGVSLSNLQTNQLRVTALGGPFSFGSTDNSGIKFKQTVSGAPGGGADSQFNSYEKDDYTDDTGLFANRYYCYQAESRNGDGIEGAPGDYSGWLPGSPQCIYTLANVPPAPRITRIDGTTINVVIKSNDENPHGGGEPDTQYAICVSKIDENNQEVAENYVDSSGQVDFSALNPNLCDTPSPTSWQPRGGWGADAGINVINLDTSKYEFRVKARNGHSPDIVTNGCTAGLDCVETVFGPAAVLVLVKNNIVGWAWSSNVGWISMNCLNLWSNPIPYGYSCDANAANGWGWNTIFEEGREINPVEGYAWSSNVGWLSAFRGVCSNNPQLACDPVNDNCGGGGNSCQVSAGSPPDGTAYGYCYNASVPAERYGQCSDNGFDCTETDLSLCGSGATCIFETCKTGDDCPPAGGTEICKTSTAANFNGVTREIEGWTRVLSRKIYGEPTFTDWGWLKLRGQYDDGAGNTGQYGLTGTEVDSQEFLGDPDVNPMDVQLYSLFGWGWQSEITDYMTTSSWLPAVNVSQTGQLQESHKTANSSMAIDSEGNPHLAWSNFNSTSNSYDIYYLKLVGGEWQTASNEEYQPGVTDPQASLLNVSNNALPSPGNSQFPSLALDTGNNPHLAWQEDGLIWEGGSIYYTYWNGTQWTAASLVDNDTNGSRTPSLKLDSAGTPYIAFQAGWMYGAPYTEIFLKKWSGSAWVSVTDNQINLNVSNTPATNSLYPSLALDSDGLPHLAWTETVGPERHVYYRRWSGSSWVTIINDSSSPGDEISVNADINTFDDVAYGFPSLALDSSNLPGIAWKGRKGTGTVNHVLYRHWNGDWVSVDNLTNPDGANLILSPVSAYNAYAKPNLTIYNNQPNVVWDDQSSNREPEVHYRRWNDSVWVNADGSISSNHDDAPFNVSGSHQPLTGSSFSASFVLDKWGNAHIIWTESSSPYDIRYTKWFPGKVQSGLGWIEFMPFGALLGIPWVQTMYSDIYAGGTIELAPPPRGSGEYTATYLILADGSIVGIPGYYPGTQTGPPTSGFVIEGLDPLIEQFGQPLGTDVLSRINTTVLTSVVGGGRNKYGHVIEAHATGGDLATLLGSNLVLNGKIYDIQGDATIESEMTFLKGDSLVNGTTGNGLIIIKGDLEINANVLYEQGTLNNVSELPSAAFIVEGDIYVDSLVNELAGVFVAKGTGTTDGYIYTSRKKVPTLAITDYLKDTHVWYAATPGTYANNYDLTSSRFGFESTEAKRHRTYLSWLINVPEGAEIRKAYIRLKDDGNSAGLDFSAKIDLIDGADINDFSAYTGQEAYQLPTVKYIDYDTSSWLAGDWNETPDISPLIQRFIDGDNYAVGNSVGIVIKEGNAESAGSGANTYKQIHACSQSSCVDAPELVIEYSPRRATYNVANDAEAWDGGSLDTACMRIGWDNDQSRAERTYLGFGPLAIPKNAEILQARLKSTICASGGSAMKVRQGLLNGNPTTFTVDPWNLSLDVNVSEVEQELTDTDWGSGTAVFRDITRLIQSFVERTGPDYEPGTATANLGLRLRRDTNETVPGSGESRSINQGATSLEVDYRVPLEVNGLLVARGYSFDRQYAKGLEPSEKIVYDGRVVANTPPGLADFTQALPIYQKVVP